MSNRWRPTKLWHNNVIGAAISIVAALILAAVSYLPGWSEYRDATRPDTAPAGGQVTAYGQTWRLGSLRRITAQPNGRAKKLPSGTVLAVVTIIRSGPPSLDYCSGVISDGKRRWKAQGINGFAAEIAEGATDSCGRPGPLQLTFLLPENVTPTTVDVTDLSGEHLMLRIVL